MQSSENLTGDGIQKFIRMYADAEALRENGQDTDAEPLYLAVLEADPRHVYCMLRLGELYNRKKEIQKSYEYHMRAFETNPKFAEILTPLGHVSHGYVYQSVEETIQETCPLCGAAGVMDSCYNDVTNLDFIPGFSPVRVWMACTACDHIFARNYPRNLLGVLSGSQGSYYMRPNTGLLSIVSEVAARIRGFAWGDRLLDIGVGAGEFAAAALEHRFEVAGIELRKPYADQVSKVLGIEVNVTDFMQYEPRKRYDVVSMGDVIEHLTNPTGAMRKANSLLNDGGVLWISTPNFRSAFSLIMKDRDPMWRVCEHLSYFSYRSMEKLLVQNGFEILDYRSSKHYNGSMELVTRKIISCSI